MPDSPASLRTLGLQQRFLGGDVFLAPVPPAAAAAAQRVGPPTGLFLAGPVPSLERPVMNSLIVPSPTDLQWEWLPAAFPRLTSLCLDNRGPDRLPPELHHPAGAAGGAL